VFIVDVGDSMIDKLKQVNDFIRGVVEKMDFGTTDVRCSFLVQKFTLEDAIGSHACSLDARTCV
jgi:hypothetical protein